MTTMKLGGLDYVTTHDNRGNQLTLGNQNYTYDARDRATGVSQNGAGQATYTRDAANRIISRTVSGSAIQFSFANGSDAPVAAYGTTGALLERYVGLLGGVMVRTTVYGWEWSLSNIAGSVVAQTSMNGTKIGTTTVYDPFGNAATALPNNRLGTFDAGWLGTVNRFTDQTADFAAIPMGARLYVPILNRFTQVDPVLGGVDNDFVWPTDPVGSSDVSGETVYFGPNQFGCGFDIIGGTNVHARTSYGRRRVGIKTQVTCAVPVNIRITVTVYRRRGWTWWENMGTETLPSDGPSSVLSFMSASMRCAPGRHYYFAIITFETWFGGRSSWTRWRSPGSYSTC